MLQPVRKWITPVGQQPHYRTYWVRPPEQPNGEPPYSAAVLKPNPAVAHRRLLQYKAALPILADAIERDPDVVPSHYRRYILHGEPDQRNEAANFGLAALSLICEAPANIDPLVLVRYRDALTKGVEPPEFDEQRATRLLQLETDIASALASMYPYQRILLHPHGYRIFEFRYKGASSNTTDDAEIENASLLSLAHTIDDGVFQERTLTPQIPLPYIQLPMRLAQVGRYASLIQYLYKTTDRASKPNTGYDENRIRSLVRAATVQVSTLVSRRHSAHAQTTQAFLQSIPKRGLVYTPDEAAIIYSYLIRKAEPQDDPQKARAQRAFAAIALMGEKPIPDAIQAHIESGEPELIQTLAAEAIQRIGEANGLPMFRTK